MLKEVESRRAGCRQVRTTGCSAADADQRDITITGTAVLVIRKDAKL